MLQIKYSRLVLYTAQAQCITCLKIVRMRTHASGDVIVLWCRAWWVVLYLAIKVIEAIHTWLDQMIIINYQHYNINYRIVFQVINVPLARGVITRDLLIFMADRLLLKTNSFIVTFDKYYWIQYKFSRVSLNIAEVILLLSISAGGFGPMRWIQLWNTIKQCDSFIHNCTCNKVRIVMKPERGSGCYM